jgi:hypothetical protein
LSKREVYTSEVITYGREYNETAAKTEWNAVKAQINANELLSAKINTATIANL